MSEAYWNELGKTIVAFYAPVRPCLDQPGYFEPEIFLCPACASARENYTHDIVFQPLTRAALATYTGIPPALEGWSWGVLCHGCSRHISPFDLSS